MKVMSLLLLLACGVLFSGCSSAPKGCGQNALSVYARLKGHKKITTEKLNSLIMSSKSSMFELQEVAEDLGINCQPVLFLTKDDIKNHAGYAILAVKKSRIDKQINHYILIEITDNKVYRVISSAERGIYSLENWTGAALLLDS